MAARKLVYHLMILSPLLTLASIALETRVFAEPWDEDPVVPTIEQSITAYVEVLRKTQQELEIDAPRPESIRAVADLWIDGRKAGELRSLPPRTYEDVPRDGARGQILEGRGLVLANLHGLIREDVRQGRYDLAAQDCLRALEVGETLKYSELYTVGASTIDQRVTLGQLEEILPHLEEQQAAEIRVRLRDLRDRQKPLDRLISLSRQQFVEASKRQGTAPLSQEDVHHLGRIGSLMEGDASPQLVIHEIKNSMVASNGRDMPLYLSSIKMGLQSQELLRERFESLIDKT